MQQALVSAFEQWGVPQRLRVDNGQPWGNRDLPPALGLWLLGLGIEVIWNRPYRPEDNGVVERAHRTNKNWVEVENCCSLAELQQRLDNAHYLQRCCYPYRNGLPRCQVYSTLERGTRPFALQRWQLARIDQWFAERIWPRRVDSSGKVSLYGCHYSVGKRHARAQVTVGFEPQTRCWKVFDERGDCLMSRPTRELSLDVIQKALVVGNIRAVRRAATG